MSTSEGSALLNDARSDASCTSAIDISVVGPCRTPSAWNKLPNVPAASSAACCEIPRDSAAVFDHLTIAGAMSSKTTRTFDIDSLRSEAASNACLPSKTNGAVIAADIIAPVFIIFLPTSSNERCALFIPPVNPDVSARNRATNSATVISAMTSQPRVHLGLFAGLFLVERVERPFR